MNESIRNQTFLPQAPGRNMEVIRSGAADIEKPLYGGTGKPVPEHRRKLAFEKLARFHNEFLSSKDVPLEEIASLEISSREQLILNAAALFDEFAVPRSEDKETMRHASLAGCGVVMAFIELEAKFFAKGGVDVEDSDQYERLMRKSIRTLLHLAATSREADGVFMTNASTWSRRDIAEKSDEEIYARLEFDESYFTLCDGTVVMKSDPETRQRASLQNGRHFDFSSSKHDILYGCPFRSRIARLHCAMFQAAQRNSILGAAIEEGAAGRSEFAYD